MNDNVRLCRTLARACIRQSKQLDADAKRDLEPLSVSVMLTAALTLGNLAVALSTTADDLEDQQA
jgi:hypothetical protein